METVLAVLMTLVYLCLVIFIVCMTIIVFVLGCMAIKTFIEDVIK